MNAYFSNKQLDWCILPVLLLTSSNAIGQVLLIRET